jgi:hypothetical protein
MINKKRSTGNSLNWIRGRRMVLLVGLILFAGCSDDSVGPESQPEPLTLVEGISYFDCINHDLRYVERAGEYWGNPEIVTYGGQVGLYSSLAIDAQGTPHIAYYDEGKQDLMYAVKTPGGWQRITVDYNGNVGGRCAIALDALGNPHVSYLDGNNHKVKHAWQSGGVWYSETVPGNAPYDWDVCEDWGNPTSIAVDANGNTHISYHTAQENLEYALKTEQGWVTEPVDNIDNVGAQCSLVLDSKGSPHISYLVGPDINRLKYAHKVEGAWQVEFIDGCWPNHCFHYVPLALDANDNPSIAFYSEGDQNLEYVVKNPGSGWSAEIVDANGNVGPHASLAIDNQGNPHLSYWDAGNNVLKCAVKINGVWSIVSADDSPGTGVYTSIALYYR